MYLGWAYAHYASTRKESNSSISTHLRTVEFIDFYAYAHYASTRKETNSSISTHLRTVPPVRRPNLAVYRSTCCPFKNEFRSLITCFNLSYLRYQRDLYFWSSFFTRETFSGACETHVSTPEPTRKQGSVGYIAAEGSAVVARKWE